MDINAIIRWILSQPASYPGKHNQSNPRTTQAKPLETHAQMFLIWRATLEYIKEKLQNGKGVNIRGFGAFTIDIMTDLPKIAPKTIASGKSLLDERKERKHVHMLRPVFVPDPAFQNTLLRFPGKNELEKPASQHSVYQKGFGMIFCNPVPIAAGCFLGQSVVKDAQGALFSAFRDLAEAGRNYQLRFGFANITITNQNMKVAFSQQIKDELDSMHYEDKMRQSDLKTTKHWKEPYSSKWKKSTLAGLTIQPNSENVKLMSKKTEALNIMSLDMASNTNY